MEGVVDSVIRHIYGKIGGYDQFTTEFVRVTDRPLPPHVFHKYAPELLNQGRTEFGDNVYVQLLGGKPQVIAENASIAVTLGAVGIDLNFGCPAKTVNRHDGGASLLKNPHRLFDVITAVKNAVPSHIPVTAKTRLGFDDKTLAGEIAAAVREAKANSLTVHARTRAEGYRPPAHWEYIARMQEHTGEVPVVANGEIWTVADYFKCREISGCANVAIGRGAMAVPDLALRIKAAVAMTEYTELNWDLVKKEILPEFFRLSKQKSMDFAGARTKQWTKSLGKGYPESIAVFDEIKILKSGDLIEKALANISTRGNNTSYVNALGSEFNSSNAARV